MHSQPQPSQDASISQSEILRLLSVAQVELPEAVSTFNPLFETAAFQLGDQLASDATSEPPGQITASQVYSENLYLVCAGRVRLLGYSAEQQREVSATVLEAGESFGADSLFCTSPIAYRAVAASPGQLARIPLSELEPWLAQLPQLQHQLQQQTQQRQQLIFFKTATVLRSLPSQQLQQLLSALVTVHVPAGTTLMQVAESNPSYFWLRYGEIRSQTDRSQSMSVGGSWAHPTATSADWIAQTDLILYQLPMAAWETAVAIAPSLAQPPSALTGLAKVPGTRTLRDASKLQIPELGRISAVSSESGTVAFPQPTQHRRSGQKIWQKYPFIQQQSAADCSITCLAMLGQYWGTRLSLNELRTLAGVGRSGTSLKNLALAAETVGFKARPVRASLGRLAEQPNPWIAHWQGDHYVVVYQIKGDRVLIADPAIGRQMLSLQTFQTHWTGYALLLDPTAQLKSIEPEQLSLNRFWALLHPYQSLIGQIIVASLLIQIFGLITPLFLQIILDRVVTQKSFITLHVFAVGLLLFGIWRIGLTGVRQYLLDYLSNRLDLTLISGFVSHTLLLPLKFFDLRQVGDIITRVQENQKVQLFLTRQMIVVWLDALMVFVYLGLMAYYHWHLALLVVGLLAVIVVLVLVATPLMRRVSREIFNQEAAETSSMVELLTGIRTVKAAAAERDLRWRWEDRFTETLNARFRGQKLANNLQVTSGLINTVGSTVLLWYGALLVIQDQLTIGQFVGFNLLFGNVTTPVLALAQLWDELQEVIVSTERLNDIFLTQPEESPHKPLLVLPRLHGHVRFENVTFRYDRDQERNIIQNLSFEAAIGQTLAIVGHSGSGKSTLMNLLQGLYQPTSGRILVDGHDLSHVSVRSLRSQLGVVPQDCFLFSGTLFENITLFRPEFTLEQAIEVAKLAEAHAFIQELPLGYNTKVGERGMTLSGGQRQRIAIARALLGDPPLLILDEATSSLDSEAERRFQHNLMRIRQGRTTFVIAHRLSTVRDADCILVLDRGILVEHGTHSELMSLRGQYHSIAQQQLAL